MTVINLFRNKPETQKDEHGKTVFLLAHGAGAPADSMFMDRLSEALVSEGIETVRFEFPYMERRRDDGRKRPPDRQPVLLEHFRQVIRQVAGDGKVIIGGKSMGGRMASLIASEPDPGEVLAGCICFGYPFHPPGKPDRWRVDHFNKFRCPVMIIQGTRDPFGRQEEVQNCEEVSSSKCQIRWLEGGDHDFKPLARQAETREILIENAAKAASAFISSLSSKD